MDTQVRTSDFQRVIEDIERLPMDDQILLVEIIRRRLIEYRRSQLVSEVAEAREAYQSGNVQRGTVEDLLRDPDGRGPWSGAPALLEPCGAAFAGSPTCARGSSGRYASWRRIRFTLRCAATS